MSLVVVLIGVAIWLTQKSITYQIQSDLGQSLQTVLETSHQAIESWVKEHESVASFWANTIDVRQATEILLATSRTREDLVESPVQGKLRTFLRPIQLAKAYKGYLIIGPDNLNLASNHLDNIGKESLLRGQTNFLKKIWMGEPAVSVPQKSDIPLTDARGTRYEMLPTMFVGAPVVDQSGETIAVFSFRIDPTEGFTNILQQGRIGKSGETYAFDQKARLISESRFDEQLRALGFLRDGEQGILNIEIRNPSVDLDNGKKIPRQELPLTFMARHATAGVSGMNLDGYLDYRGESVVGAWLWDPKLGFGITTEVDVVEAYETLNFIRSVGTAMAGFSLLLLLGLTSAFIINRKWITESENRLRKIIDLVPSMIFVKNRNGQFLLANQAVADAYGTTVENLVNNKDNESHNKTDETEILLDDDRAIIESREAKFMSDEIFVDAQGNRRVLQTVKIPCVISGREQQTVLYVATDITERKHAEEELILYRNQLEQLVSERTRKLKESEEHLRSVVETALSIILWLALEGRILGLNREAERLYGKKREKILGENYLELLIPEAERQAVEAALKKVIAGRPMRNFETSMILGDGAQCNIVWNIDRLTEADGQPKGIIAVGLDITERKRVEERLRLTQKVFEDTAEAIMITDQKKRIIEVNEALCLMTGYGRDELIGQTPKILNSGHHDREFSNEMWENLKARGHWQGEIWDRRKDGQVYPSWASISAVKNDTGQLSHYVALLSDITTIKETEQRLEQLAHFDQLTGLANRMLFHDRLRGALARAHRHGKRLAVFYVDLDSFKQVNDTLGHKAGDDILVRAGHALSSSIREGDTVARLGGDEFGIILNDLENADLAQVLAQRIVEALSISVRFGARELQVSSSVGVALYPTDGEDEEALLRNADQAMYHAKKQGKNTYQFYDPSINLRMVDRIHLESDLRSAIKQGHLFVQYQPKFDLRKGCIVGVEALARWRDPERGLVSPDTFIPVAEESGLIVAIGRFVLEKACHQACKWHRCNKELPVAVNLSARQFRHEYIAEDIQEILLKTGLPSQLLEIEVTESLVMDDMSQTVIVLAKLKKMGVRISVDDFGTGYSSLSYLKRLPVDALKIDRSFVMDIPRDKDDGAIVSAIISMAHSLNQKVTAEGVENMDQLDFLSAKHCNEIQGYLISPPVFPEDIDDMVSRVEDQLTMA